MNKIIAIILLGISLKAAGQTQVIKDSITNFVLSKYLVNPDSSGMTHSVDTIIKLKKSKYFVLVKNETYGSASDAGTYDYYEVELLDAPWISSSLLNVGNNNSSGGIVDIQYRVYYISNVDYIILALNLNTHMGTHHRFSIVLNSSVKLLDVTISDEQYGIIGGLQFTDVVSLKREKGYVSEFTFKSHIVNRMGDTDNFRVSESTYRIASSDFNLFLNCIMKVELINKKVSIYRG